jgi:hypothetical protein
MVTNTFLTNDQITEEALIVLQNKLAFGNRCIRSFDGNFGQEGAKVGDNLRVRVPPRYVTTLGPAPAAQNMQESYREIAAQNQRNVLLQYTTKDRALAIDNFSERFVDPAMVQLASDIDTDGTLAATVGYTVTNSGYFGAAPPGANYAGPYAGFMGLVTQAGYAANGTPLPWTGGSVGNGGVGGQSTAQANATAAFFNADARLAEAGAPAEDRYCVVAPQAAAVMIPNIFTNFNPSAQIGKMFQQGIIGQLAGADFYKSTSVQTFTSGNWVNSGAATNVAVTVATQGSTTLVVNNIGNNANVVSGDQLVIAGINAVNPTTRQGAVLQVFTVVGPAQAAANGQVTLTVFPQMVSTGNMQTISAMPTFQNAVTLLGTASTSTYANFYYQKNAIALAVAPLSDDCPGAEVSRATSEEDGLSVRFVRQHQASIDQTVARLDILYGWGVVRPELGVLVKG